MDLWDVTQDVHERAALNKFACIGARRVQLGTMLSGRGRPVTVWTDDHRCVDEMLWAHDVSVYGRQS